MARLLCLALMLGPGIGGAQAQITIAPYVTGVLGVSQTQERIPIQTIPPTSNSYATHYWNVLATINVGIEFGPNFAVDASFRSSVGIGQPFRALTLGPSSRWGQRVQIHFRGGLGRVQGSRAVAACIGILGSPCPRYSISEWATGFDLGAGVDFRRGTRWSIGPVVWWAQTAGGTFQYRSIGLGAHVRYR